MNRRAIAVAALALLLAALPAGAQDKGDHRIAVISAATPVEDLGPDGPALWRALFKELARLGYVEGDNLEVRRWSGGGRTEAYGALARAVTSLRPELIFVPSTPLVRALQALPSDIPLVTVLNDPVGYGIVPSLANPGGRVTGMTIDVGLDLHAKRLELLRIAVPAASRVAYLTTRVMWDGEAGAGQAMRKAAERLDVTLIGVPLDTPIDAAAYARAFAVIAEARVDALLVGADAENFSNRALIATLAAEAALPSMASFTEAAGAGALMAYGVDLPDAYRRVATYIDRVLQGAAPADLPFQQAGSLHLIINLTTADTLGVTPPPPRNIHPRRRGNQLMDRRTFRAYPVVTHTHYM